MKKRILSIVLALCLVFSLLPVSALADEAPTSGTCGDNLTWALADDGTLTISGEGEMNSYSSSKNTDGAWVTTAPWGKHYKSIKSVVIEDGVTSIGGWAFYDCSSLTSVTIPDGVTIIDGSVFSGCSSLTSVTIPDGVTSIGNSAFSNCTALTSITIPDGVTSIGDSAFSFCGSLTSVTIPDSITTIGEWAFMNCKSIKDVYYIGDISSWLEISFKGRESNPCINGVNVYFNGELVTDIVIPNGVTSIGDYALEGFSSVASVTIPEGVTSIGEYAFSDCGAITVTIPDSITKIGNGAFCAFSGYSSIKNIYYTGDASSWFGIDFEDNNSNPCHSGAKLHFNGELVTDVVIPNGVTSIGRYALSNCSTLTSITIPDSVTSIGEYAFDGCTNLTSVTIPKSIKNIGGYAFSNCSNIKNIYYTGDLSSWLEISFGYTSNYGDGANLYFNGELATDVVIPDGVKSIGNFAFYCCSSLTSVKIPDSVTNIGSYAFGICKNLTSVTIPSSITRFGEEPFRWCYKLEDVAFGGTKEAWQAVGCEIPGNVRMHYNCTSLEGHLVPIESKEPSCTSDGYVKYICDCGYEYTQTVPKSHNYVLIKSAAPTCTEHGYDLFACSKCGAEKKEYKDDKLLEHSYQITVVKPTCLTGGYTLHKCSVCGDSYKDELVQPLGHSEVSAEAKAPTCTETGRNAGTCCLSCGKVMSGMEEIAALGHSYKNGICTRCNAKSPNYVAAPVIKIATSAGKPKISWSKVDGATKYYIYRSTDGKTYKQYTTTTKTSYADSNAKIGTTYYYKVKAAKVVNGKTVYSAYSNVKSIKCTPAAPVVSISRSNGKPKLTWKAVTGASKYYIYRSTDGKSYKQYTTTTKTTYTNTGAASGKKYYYKVKAVAVVNNKNVFSAYSTAKNLMTTIATPTVSITTASGKPKVSWKAVTGADKYIVYRSTDGKTFKQLSTTTKTSLTNTGAKKNTKYYYKVKAVCSANTSANSALSKAVSIKATK